jgi:hypothetical protein
MAQASAATMITPTARSVLPVSMNAAYEGDAEPLLKGTFSYSSE